MRLLSIVQAKRIARALCWPVLLTFAIVPQWSGAVRLPLLAEDTGFTAGPVAVAQRRYGRLDLVDVIRLDSDASAFGGFSALSLADGRATLLGDGGNWIRFSLHRGAITDRASGALPAGPGTGWEKKERDSEAMALHGDHAWIGFERANEIWRYRADLSRAEARIRPAGMRNWATNGGAESLARLGDGRFIVIAESSRGNRPRHALLFSADPAAPATTAARLFYRPPAGYDPVDAAILPSGDLLVLNRRFSLPFRFTATLVLVPHGAIRAKAMLRGRVVAMIDGALSENWEALAVTQQRGQTVIWLANDNDGNFWRRSMLARFVWRGG